jgi:DNA-binding CsgD family transcriptional regulator
MIRAMAGGPVRVAVVSRSTIVRAGLVALVGELGDRAVVVRTAAPDGRPNGFDVALFDLDARDQKGASEELRILATVGAPVIGVVYERGTAQPPMLGSLRLLTLAATKDELWTAIGASLSRAPAQPAPRGTRTLPDGLSPRELEVLRLIATGVSNSEVAEQLFLSPNSIKTYIRTAYKKTGVTNRTSAVLWAMEHGLVSGSGIPGS